MANRFSKSYWSRRRKEQARRRKADASPYVVIVYDKKAENPAFSMVEKKRFSSYEAATEYANIYANSETLGAYVQ